MGALLTVLQVVKLMTPSHVPGNVQDEPVEPLRKGVSGCDWLKKWISRSELSYLSHVNAFAARAAVLVELLNKEINIAVDMLLLSQHCPRGKCRDKLLSYFAMFFRVPFSSDSGLFPTQVLEFRLDKGLAVAHGSHVDVMHSLRGPEGDLVRPDADNLGWGRRQGRVRYQ